jgi:hypothetical protein
MVDKDRKDRVAAMISQNAVEPRKDLQPLLLPELDWYS